MRIWKWSLSVADQKALHRTRNARMLSVQYRSSAPQPWAMVNEEAPLNRSRLATFGTGNHLPDDPGEYIGTYHVRDCVLVSHVLEAER